MFISNFKEGCTYRTHGGWLAMVIWIDHRLGSDSFYVIHKPRTTEESSPMLHDSKGRARPLMSIYEPPLYDKHHPADLILAED